MNTLESLKRWKGVFDSEAARRVEALLAKVPQPKLAEQAIELHELLLFFRAYPQSRRVAALADRALNTFRATDDPAFDEPEVSGIAGSTISTAFSHEFASALVSRHGRTIEIDWENYERPDRLGSVLATLLPAAAEAWTVEPHIDWGRWFRESRVTLAELLACLEPRAYDLLEIPLRWHLGTSAASRTRTRLGPVTFIHDGPLLRRKHVSFEAEFASRPVRCRRLPRKQAEETFLVMLDTSAVRYRELWGFQYPDLDHFYVADFGRGVVFYFCGIAPEARLPLRAYHAGMYFKNGVPIGYFEGLSLYDRMEAGFNLYYTFRDGETAWLYGRTLKLFRERLGVACFSIDPYQIGHENPEAIDSGAFWFYRKLGFRPALPEMARLAEQEEKKLAAHPDYRTSPSILRKLATSHMLYGTSKHARFSAVDRALKIDRARVPPWPESLTNAKYAGEETEFLRLTRTR